MNCILFLVLLLILSEMGSKKGKNYTRNNKRKFNFQASGKRKKKTKSSDNVVTPSPRKQVSRTRDSQDRRTDKKMQREYT